VKVSVPLKLAAAMWVVEASRCGRSNAVYAMSMPTGRRPKRTVARNRVPAPIGPAVSFSETSMLGL
jgi:hypothetical protein